MSAYRLCVCVSKCANVKGNGGGGRRRRRRGEEEEG